VRTGTAPRLADFQQAQSGRLADVALTGFRYEGDRAHVIAIPPITNAAFRDFWATGTGWGTYSLQRNAGGGVRFVRQVIAGNLFCASCALDTYWARQATAKIGTKNLVTRIEKSDTETTLHFSEPI
jgi:hypothetical protein